VSSRTGGGGDKFPRSVYPKPFCVFRRKFYRRIVCLAQGLQVYIIYNETFIDRSIIKWVQCACVSTMKLESSFNLFYFIKHLRRSIYPVLVSNKGHSNNRGIIHTSTLIYYMTKHVHLFTRSRESIVFGSPSTAVVALGFAFATTAVSGPQNTLFPSVSVNK
jgi:hypothetical protein